MKRDMCNEPIEDDLGICEVCGLRPATTQCHGHDCDNACPSANDDGDPPTRCCGACTAIDPLACVEICKLCVDHWAAVLEHDEECPDYCDKCTFEKLKAQTDKELDEHIKLCVWVDGPDSEVARAGRREDPGCHAWYACDDASVSVRPRGGFVRVATSLSPADLDPGQAEELARHLQACAAWLRAQKDGSR